VKPFATDDQLAARLRAVEAKLRIRSVADLAAEIAAIALILEPEDAPA
jgi:hypothetical protein